MYSFLANECSFEGSNLKENFKKSLGHRCFNHLGGLPGNAVVSSKTRGLGCEESEALNLANRDLAAAEA